MKLLYENVEYKITLTAIDGDPSTCVFEITCDRPDVVTITQDTTNLNEFNIDIETLGENNEFTKLAYKVTNNKDDVNITYEYAILCKENNNDTLYYSKVETCGLFVYTENYTNEDILAKLLNVDGSGSGLDADFLDGHDSSVSSLASTIPVANGQGRLNSGWTYQPPNIESVLWDSDMHVVERSYVLTINASDSAGLDLLYFVECDDVDVSIIPRIGFPHIFDIEYGNYIYNTDIKYKITVINERELSSILVIDKTIIKVIQLQYPNINDVSWDNDYHTENNQYLLTIEATDPQGLDLTYTVTYDPPPGDPDITITPHPNYENIFIIDYGEYEQNTDIIYVIMVTNLKNYSNTTNKEQLVYDTDIYINGVAWDDNIYWELSSYVMTIDAYDPQGLDLTYDVTCDPPAGVDIVQRAGVGNEHIFDITYPSYSSNTNIEYTITIGNVEGASDIETRNITVRDANPSISSMSWNDDDHWESQTYFLTIVASDPGNLPLTYEMTCDPPAGVTISPMTGHPHILRIVYDNFDENEDLTYTITVRNTKSLTDQDTNYITVQNVAAPPVINSISWNTSDHIEENIYMMAIAATDPNNQNLTYDVQCNYSAPDVIIAQQGSQPIFDITYGSYDENTPVVFTITVTNEELLTDVETENITILYIQEDPVITNITWSPSENHFENESYILTIDATDPNNQNLTYDVVCNPPTGVTINSPGNNNVFDITYGEFTSNTDVVFTITATNEDLRDDEITRNITVQNVAIPPVITDISWNPTGNQYEKNSYEMTINATDPKGLDLTYDIQCNYSAPDVTIAQQGSQPIFDITYGEFTSNTDVVFTITVMNTEPLSTVTTRDITVYNIEMAPNISDISWNPTGNQYEENSYEMTVNATDPQDQTLAYDVQCDHSAPDVVIVQQSFPNHHKFDITYGEQDKDTSMEYEITVTNEDNLTHQLLNNITVHDANPLISNISWNDTYHKDNNTYVMTISATDPRSQTLSYEVQTDDNQINIDQHASPNLHKFNITYPDYNHNYIQQFNIRVSNSLYDSFDSTSITVYDIHGRGIFAGGIGTTRYDTIEYITILTPGNVIDFGDLSVAKTWISATSNGTLNRGIFAGGYDDNQSHVNTIEYINISAAPGNVIDFGDLSAPKSQLAATSNGTNDRGVFAGGISSSGYYDTIEYITISAATGSITDFGDLSTGKSRLVATSNGTNDRGVFAGGHDGSYFDVIEYINISAATGSVTDFGDLSVAKRGLAATSNGTNNRGVFAGGINGTTRYDTIEYITISAGTGDATDFGNLSAAKYALAATSNSTNNRGIFAGGGIFGNNNINVIEYIYISADTGDASDFGDLSVAKSDLSATSDA